MTLLHPNDRQLRIGLTAVVLATIAFIAYTDGQVTTNLSLGYLYLLPIGISSLIHRPSMTFALVLVCLILREWLGPFLQEGWPVVVRSLIFAGVAFLATAMIRKLSEQRRSLAGIVESQRDQMEAELRQAAQVQQRLLPQQPPQTDGLEIAIRLLPAKILGGDFYDFIHLSGTQIGVVIADVSGKGAPAGLLMPAILSTLRICALRLRRIDALLSEINDVLFEVTEPNRYVSLFFGIFDTSTWTLEYSNAGHHAPLHFHSPNADADVLDTGGPVIALINHAHYETATIECSPSDVIVLYTDGVIEAEGPDGEHYGLNRLKTAVRAVADQSAERILETVIKDVLGYSASTELQDDTTVMVLRRSPEASRTVA